MQGSPRTHYDPLSRAFHWITAVAVTVAFILGPGGFGRLMRNGVDPASRLDIVWHESLGLLVLTLTVVRLIWVAARPAAPRFEMSPLMHGVAKLVQWLMWVLLLALPLTALLALGGEGHPLTVLGGVRVDQMPWIANNPVAHWADWGDVHGLLGDTIMWLAGLHAVAALFHHFILKDGVLASMLPHRRAR